MIDHNENIPEFDDQHLEIVKLFLSKLKEKLFDFSQGKAVSASWFLTNAGICDMFGFWFTDGVKPHAPSEYYIALKSMFTKWLTAKGSLNPDWHPFNISLENHHAERIDNTIWKNLDRVDFVENWEKYV